MNQQLDKSNREMIVTFSYLGKEVVGKKTSHKELHRMDLNQSKTSCLINSWVFANLT